MTTGTERLQAAAQEAGGLTPKACLQCSRLMRSGRTPPNGHPPHSGHGLCSACYNAVLKAGGSPRDVGAALAIELETFTNSDAFTEKQLSNLGSSAPGVHRLILKRRKRGVPAEGVLAHL